MRIAPGVRLEPGSDGVLPVRVRWVRRLYAPEQIAVDRGVVYAADERFKAFRLSTGSMLWQVGDPSHNGLHADGGVEIGRARPNRVRAWAPYNFDLVANRSTGRLVRLRLRAGGDQPRGLHAFAAPPSSRFKVSVPRAGQMVAQSEDGSLAWRIIVVRPWFSAVPPIEVPGGMVLLTGSGHLVRLDYV